MFIMIWHHKHGEDLYSFDTLDEARMGIRQIVLDNACESSGETWAQGVLRSAAASDWQRAIGQYEDYHGDEWFQVTAPPCYPKGLSEAWMVHQAQQALEALGDAS
jgi:hypothetical protein